MLEECERLREENMRLVYQSKLTINIREHEDQIRTLSNNNKQLSEKMDTDTSEYKRHLRNMESDLEDYKHKHEKKELQICQLECENKVFKKMMIKYENLVEGLRQTVSILTFQFQMRKKIWLNSIFRFQAFQMNVKNCNRKL